MRRIIIVTTLFLALGSAAACSKDPVPGADGNPVVPGATNSAGEQIDPGASPGATGAPGNGQTGGTTADKAVCATLTTKLSDWGSSFAEVAGGLAAAGTDVSKVQPIVNNAKTANTKFATELRAEGGKSADPEVKKVAEGLAVTMEKINGQLNAEAIAKDPNALLAIFDTPEFAASAEAFEKVCGAV
jgi:hypothetical protein